MPYYISHASSEHKWELECLIRAQTIGNILQRQINCIDTPMGSTEYLTLAESKFNAEETWELECLIGTQTIANVLQWQMICIGIHRFSKTVGSTICRRSTFFCLVVSMYHSSCHVDLRSKIYVKLYFCKSFSSRVKPSQDFASPRAEPSHLLSRSATTSQGRERSVVWEEISIYRCKST